jgi:ppGpp synthetase/RelA/SpoT-type nucleotidyltranferase
MSISRSNLKSRVGDPKQRHNCERLVKEIRDDIQSIGVFSRVFGRVKEKKSIINKIERKNYKYIDGDEKIQDLFGVRVVLYFEEDINIVERILESKFSIVDRNPPNQSEDVFGPAPNNLIFENPQRARNCRYVRNHDFIDDTFEVQVRTIFSEGWHEIEHDLRYKQKDDWDGFDELSRALNRIMATLESCSWSIEKILNDLAEEHLSNANVPAMLRARFRLRLKETGGFSEVIDHAESNEGFRESLYSINKESILRVFLSIPEDLPTTIPVFIFIANRYFVGDPAVKDYEPDFLNSLFDSEDTIV